MHGWEPPHFLSISFTSFWHPYLISLYTFAAFISLLAYTLDLSFILVDHLEFQSVWPSSVPSYFDKQTHQSLNIVLKWHKIAWLPASSYAHLLVINILLNGFISYTTIWCIPWRILLESQEYNVCEACIASLKIDFTYFFPMVYIWLVTHITLDVHAYVTSLHPHQLQTSFWGLSNALLTFLYHLI